MLPYPDDDPSLFFVAGIDELETMEKLEIRRGRLRVEFLRRAVSTPLRQRRPPPGHRFNIILLAIDKLSIMMG